MYSTTSVFGSNSCTIFARLDRFYGDDRDDENEYFGGQIESYDCITSRQVLVVSELI